MPGTVHKIIPSLGLRRTEKAQIAVDGAERLHRNFRIENALLDENGEDVKLKKGSRVEITVSTGSQILSATREVASDSAARVKEAAKP